MNLYQGGIIESDKENDTQSDIQTTNKRQTNDKPIYRRKKE